MIAFPDFQDHHKIDLVTGFVIAHFQDASIVKPIDKK